MKKITFEGTLKIPNINFDPDIGLIELSGRSTPENSEAIYRPLIEWVQDYAKNPLDKTIVNIDFEYFNSSTAKYLIRLLEAFITVHEAGKELEINWYYDDDELKEYGEDFEEVLELPFNYIKHK